MLATPCKLAALELANLGYRVIPVNPRGRDGKKPPLISDHVNAASSMVATINTWWSEWPDANLAVLLEDVFLIDIDGPEGLASLARYEDTHRKLPPAPCEASGRGLHYFFRGPKQPIEHQGGIPNYPGMEVWHGNRYVVVAPSIHASGAQYEWKSEARLPPVSELDKLPLLPDDLLKLIEKPKSKRAARRAPRREILEHLQDILPAIREGAARNEAVFKQLLPACLKDGHKKADIAAKLTEIVQSVNEASPASDPYTLKEAKDSLRSIKADYHKPKRQPKTPALFRVDEQGVYADEGAGEIRISGPVELLAEVRDEQSSGWSKLFRFRNRDGRDAELLVQNSLLHQPSKDVLSTFAEVGLELEASQRAEILFILYLKQLSTDTRKRLVARIGWHGSQFVLPDKVIGPNAEGEEIVYKDRGQPHDLHQRGELADWREIIAARCVGNSRLILAVSAAFAAPVLSLLGHTGAGIHFRGATSIGKSTLLRVAGSVCGGPGYIKSWRSTGNALEGVAEAHNHCLLALDEIGEADARSVGQTAYMLANGSGKRRMRPDGTLRRAAEWCLLFVSSGESSLAETIKQTDSRRDTKGGQELRLVDLPADAGAGLGLFENIHGAASARQFADDLNTAVQYENGTGTAFLTWLEMLTTRRVPLGEEIRGHIARFMARRGELGAEAGRVAGLFALIGAAGEAARPITGWQAGEALRGAETCFTAWLDSRGTSGGFDIEKGVRQVRLFIQQHGSSRFQGDALVGENGEEFEPRVINRAGYKRAGPQGMEYWVLPDTWRDEICRGLDSESVARELARRGLLMTDGKHLRVKRSIPEGGRVRVLAILGKILSDDEPEEGQGVLDLPLAA
jgi:uncharacterized protein (DUF927 family)